jgi:pyrroline-5-carboxylate reductase
MRKTFGVIGCGNMAEALLRGALSAGRLAAEEILCADVDAGRRERFAEAFSVEVCDDTPRAATCERLLLAVKPQVLPEVLEAIRDSLREDALVISIAAGVKTGKISEMLGGRGRVLRVMPNTPMLVGAGMSVLAGGPGATEGDLAWAQGLFSACGETEVAEENDLDAVTAVSGSGPAYVFYLAEAMIQAGIREGLGEDLASRLAVQTCLGAGQLLKQTGIDPRTLRRQVSSPGGTTQAATEHLDEQGVQEAMEAAVRAAAARSRELGK